MRWAPPQPDHQPLLALGLADGRMQLVRPQPRPSSDGASTSAANVASRQPPSADSAAAVCSGEGAAASGISGGGGGGGGAAAGEAHGEGDAAGWQEAAAVDVGHDMVLTVDWARHCDRQGRAVASTSSGYLAILQVRVQTKSCAACRSRE